MPVTNPSAPTSGQPIDRLGLTIGAARGAGHGADPQWMNTNYSQCFADAQGMAPGTCGGGYQLPFAADEG